MMDLFLLLFTGLFLRLSTTGLRIFGAGILGSLYSCAAAVGECWLWNAHTDAVIAGSKMPDSMIIALIGYVPVCMLMLGITFGVQRSYNLLKTVAVFYTVAAFTGGVMQFTLHFFTRFAHLFFTRTAIAWLALILGLLTAALAAVYLLRIYFKNRSLGGKIYHICLEFQGKYVCLKALYDTGNFMCDPYSGQPVTIVEEHLLQSLLPPGFTQFRSIPYQSLGNARGQLRSVKVDTVIIRSDEKVWQYADACIGGYPGTLSRAGNYAGILHPDMLAGAKKLD